MSEYYRITAPPEFASLTLRDLARKCHVAENTADDVLLLEVQNELLRRGRVLNRDLTGVFMEFYRDLWTTEFRPK